MHHFIFAFNFVKTYFSEIIISRCILQ